MPNVRIRELKFAALCLLPLLACGCASNMGPKMPKELGAPSISAYPVDEFKSNLGKYRNDVASGDLKGALDLRNEMAYRVMADIESSYGSFEMKLSSSRATQSTLADATMLGLTAATTVVGASDVKDILAATGTAFQGTWTSYDKNFFQQKTTEAIISQMRASRKTKQAQLIKNLDKLDVTKYPWDAVWVDLVDFYYAGTVPSAMVEIASASGKQAVAAADNLNQTIRSLTSSTPAQADMETANRTAYEKLKKMGQDSSTADAARQKAAEILKAADYPAPEGESLDDLLKTFRQAIIDAATDNGKLTDLYNAVSAVKID